MIIYKVQTTHILIAFDVNLSSFICFQEKILLDPMFDVPGSDVKSVLVDEDVVRGEKPAQYIREAVSTEQSDEFEEDGKELKSASG